MILESKLDLWMFSFTTEHIQHYKFTRALDPDRRERSQCHRILAFLTESIRDRRLVGEHERIV